MSFEAYGGQILGFAGLVGAGRTETARAIFGADPIDGGTIQVNGKEHAIRSPKQAIAAGIALLTEDRKGQGLVLAQSVRTNLVLSSFKQHSSGAFLNEKKIEASGQQHIQTLRIKTPSLDEIAGQLSGGNQQKVVIGKWLNTDADIFIFDEPTRGIDVGAKVEVYNVMNSLVKAGKCVIMISSEMPEILGMSDRVVVMRGGRVMATVDRDSPHFNQEDIMKAVITVIGKDMVGILAKVSTACADANANVVEVTQSVLDKYFAMIMLVDISKLNCSLEELKNSIETIVPTMTVHVMHEDIFNSMHRI